MVKQRENYKFVILEPALTRIKNNQCPNCASPKEQRKRRKDWTCCSKKCSEEHQKNYTYFGWPDLRLKAIKRDNYTCTKCGIRPLKIKDIPEKFDGERWIWRKEQTDKPDDSQLIGDHITPIALGGEEWDINNVQTLCIQCNKIKTAIDAKKIALARYSEKQQKSNHTLEVTTCPNPNQ